MKLFNKILTFGLSTLMFIGVGASLVSFKAAKENVQVVEATEGYTTYHNEDLGFATRDPNDTRYVKGDADGGMQTKGAVLSEKSELLLNFKKAQDNYWIGVGGYAVYVSSGTSIRFLYLTRNSNGQYSRGQEKSGLALKTADGSTDLKDVITGGKYYSDFADITLRLDLSNPSAVKLEFFVEYSGVTYYPFESSTKIGEYTYTHPASGFSSEDQYRAMAGVPSNDSGISILEFNTYRKDLSTVISGANGVFNYSLIGDITFSLPFSEPITDLNDIYLNDHLSSWLDEKGNPVDIGNGILINGKTFNYWINFTDPNLTYDTSNDHGIHTSPLRYGNQFSPVTINVNSSRIKFFFNTAFIPSDSIIITFKADKFRGHYNNHVFVLENDLTFYASLNPDNYGSVGTNIKLSTSVSETVEEYSITNLGDWGEQTAAGGAKYRKFAIYTNIPRDKTNINQAFPHDHYRYMFENVIFNGKTLNFYNVWGRGNNKDFTDLSTPVANPDYETEHPAGLTEPKYNLATYLNIATDQDNYVFFVDIPNQLMTDFGFSTYNFSLRDGSAWKTPSGVVRLNISPADKYAVTNFVDDNMKFDTISADNNSDTGACRNGSYLTAKAALNQLSSGQINFFANTANDSDIVAARARYEAWAIANNDAAPYDGNNSVVSTISRNYFAVLSNDSNSNTVIIVVSIIAMSTLVLFAFIAYKKRKTDR